MNKNFWKRILPHAGFVFFLSIIGFTTFAIVRSASGELPISGAAAVFGTICAVIIASLIPTVVIIIPYAFYVYGKMSRENSPNIDPASHTAFKNPANAPANSPTAAASAAHPNAVHYANQPTGPALIGVSDIFENSWKFYRNNFKKMWPLFLLGGLGVTGVNFTFTAIIDSSEGVFNLHAPIFILPLAITFILIIGALLLWSKIALFKGIIDAKKSQFLGFKDSFGKAKIIFLPFLLMIILVALAKSGGLILLIVPGIILSGYLIFTEIIFIDTGKKNFSAMTASWSLVKKHWWGTVLRLIAVSILLAVISFAVTIVFIICVGIIIAILAVLAVPWPFLIVLVVIATIPLIGFSVLVIEPVTILCLFEVYYSLMQVRAGELSEDAPVVSWRKKKLIIVVIIAIIAFIPETYFGFKFESWAQQMQANIKSAGLRENYASNISAIAGLASSSTDLQEQPYAADPGQFQINLPTGWIFNQNSIAPEQGILSETDFAAPAGQQSSMSIDQIDTAALRNIFSTSTDEAIALNLAKSTIASINEGLTAQNLEGFAISDLTTQTLGNDTEYIYRGSASSGPPNYTTTVDFKLITIFNGDDGYQILALWPESEYGWAAKPIQDSLGTFRILK